MENKTVAVIGGGLGALSGAIRLARLGFSVQLFEKNPQLGGKVNEVVLADYRFDTGASLLTMPSVIDELFNFAGFTRSDYLDFVPIDPICRYFFPDGSVMDASADKTKMKAAIAQLSPSDVKAYERFLKYAERIHNLTAEIFMFTPIHEFRKLMRHRHFRTLFRLHQIDPFRTVHQSVSRFFSDSRLIQLFDRYATYMNGITGLGPQKSKIPFYYDTDKEAIEVALNTIGLTPPEDAKVARVESTLTLATLDISEAFIEDAELRSDLEIVGEVKPFEFDDAGNLAPF